MPRDVAHRLHQEPASESEEAKLDHAAPNIHAPPRHKATLAEKNSTVFYARSGGGIENPKKMTVGTASTLDGA